MSLNDRKIIVFRGFPTRGCYTVSPFVTKLEFRFRHGGLQHVLEGGSPRDSPMGKIPFVDIGPIVGSSPGVSLLSDSTLIIKRLVEMGEIPDLEKPLSALQRTTDLAIRALLEDKLYFFQSRERWMDNYYTQRDTVLHSMPHLMRVIVGLMVYRKESQLLQSQGIGRYPTAEFESLKAEVWESISEMLEAQMRMTGPDEAFWCLGGKEPTDADATLFGFIISVLISPASPTSKNLVKGLPALVEYAERIHNRWFPDYELWD